MTKIIKQSCFGTPSGYAFMRVTTDRGYKSGKALQRHIDSAHGGNFDPKCQACREIQDKVQRASK